MDVMKKLNIGLLAVVGVCCLSSCIEHQRKTEDDKTEKNTKSEQTFIKEKNYPGIRIYSGRIPCEDCSGIEQRLVLKGDTMGIYRLTEVYKDATEDGDAVLVSTGEWEFRGKNMSAPEIVYLSQGHIGDSVRVASYQYKKDRILQLELNGDSVTNKASYSLRLLKHSR